jgi:hypothetical protein
MEDNELSGKDVAVLDGQQPCGRRLRHQQLGLDEAATIPRRRQAGRHVQSTSTSPQRSHCSSIGP